MTNRVILKTTLIRAHLVVSLQGGHSVSGPI